MAPSGASPTRWRGCWATRAAGSTSSSATSSLTRRRRWSSRCFYPSPLLFSRPRGVCPYVAPSRCLCPPSVVDGRAGERPEPVRGRLLAAAAAGASAPPTRRSGCFYPSPPPTGGPLSGRFCPLPLGAYAPPLAAAAQRDGRDERLLGAALDVRRRTVARHRRRHVIVRRAGRRRRRRRRRWRGGRGDGRHGRRRDARAWRDGAVAADRALVATQLARRGAGLAQQGRWCWWCWWCWWWRCWRRWRRWRRWRWWRWRRWCDAHEQGADEQQRPRAAKGAADWVRTELAAATARGQPDRGRRRAAHGASFAQHQLQRGGAASRHAARQRGAAAAAASQQRRRQHERQHERQCRWALAQQGRGWRWRRRWRHRSHQLGGAKEGGALLLRKAPTRPSPHLAGGRRAAGASTPLSLPSPATAAHAPPMYRSRVLLPLPLGAHAPPLPTCGRRPPSTSRRGRSTSTSRPKTAGGSACAACSTRRRRRPRTVRDAPIPTRSPTPSPHHPHSESLNPTPSPHSARTRSHTIPPRSPSPHALPTVLMRS